MPVHPGSVKSDMTDHPTSPTAFSGLFKKESKVEDDWIEWKGGKCPVPEGTLVDVKHMDGDTFYSIRALSPEDIYAENWAVTEEKGSIVAYRVVTPRPDLEEVSEYLRGNAWKTNPVGWSTATWAIPEGLEGKNPTKVISDEVSTNKYLRPFPYDTIDIYRVLQVYEVTDPCIQHAVKKLLCAGQRGYKEVEKDIDEAIQSMERWKQMREEEDGNPNKAS